MPNVSVISFVACIFLCSHVMGFDGVRSVWEGFTKTSFEVDGRPCFVVEPHQAAPGKPWLWRARFPTYHAEIDKLLLADGYHVAYINTDDFFGSPAAMEYWSAFYEKLTKHYDLNLRPALYGVSRGGLFVYRWAKQHPETVACIYNDTPVCDFKSWPGGLGKGKGDADAWTRCLTVYGLDEQGALAYDDNPVDRLAPIADAQIPIMHIVTEDDQHVPPDENTYLLKNRLESLGHREFHVVSLPHGTRLEGHHFDLTHPEIGYFFVRKHSSETEPFPIYLRGGLNNSHHVFTSQRRGRVAFLGGSITEMSGWRELVQQSLRNRFPQTKFDFIDAGIASTDSTFAAFRLQHDVFHRGPVDLLFMESAVNELHNRRSADEITLALEGVVLAARRHNPNIDFVTQYFFDDEYVEEYRSGKTPRQIVALERVALQYGLNAIDQAAHVRELFDERQITPTEFGGVHPAPAGHRVYAELVDAMFDLAWKPERLAFASSPDVMPWPIDLKAFSRGHLVPIEEVQIAHGWSIQSNWTPSNGGATRPGFVDVPFLSATESGAECSIEFSGTAIGLVVAAGPDAGILEYEIDGGQTRSIDQFTPWSAGLNIPWIYLLDSRLDDASHKLTLRMTDRRHPQSTGNACHIRMIAVNGADMPLAP